MNHAHVHPRALAAGLSVLAVSAGAIVLGSGGAAGAPAPINPFADAGGFSVYVREDARLDNSEVEGALAVGGALDAVAPGQRFPIVHKVAGTSDYTIPVIDGDPTRLLVGTVSPASGVIDVTGHDGDSGLHWGFAKVAQPEEPAWLFAERGGYTQYRLDAPGSEAGGPVIEAKNQPWVSEGRDSMITALPSVADYFGQGQGDEVVAACLAELAEPSADGSAQVTVTNDGGKARLDLTAGTVNVVDYDDLFLSGVFASQITYADAVPAIDTPVVVRVPAGTTAVRGIEFGSAGQYPRFVMWDLSALSGPVSLTDKQGGAARIDGSFYGPEVDLTARFGPLDGQVLVRNLVTEPGTGELHAYMFASSLTCESGPSASPEPSVSPSASPEPSVSPTGEATPEPSDVSSPAPTGTVTATVEDESLSRTGADSLLWSGVALGLGAVGAAVLLASSRRRA